jgi:hypothetical protein
MLHVESTAPADTCAYTGRAHRDAAQIRRVAPAACGRGPHRAARPDPVQEERAPRCRRAAPGRARGGVGGPQPQAGARSPPAIYGSRRGGCRRRAPQEEGRGRGEARARRAARQRIGQDGRGRGPHSRAAAAACWAALVPQGAQRDAGLRPDLQQAGRAGATPPSRPRAGRGRRRLRPATTRRVWVQGRRKVCGAVIAAGVSRAAVLETVEEWEVTTGSSWRLNISLACMWRCHHIDAFSKQSTAHGRFGSGHYRGARNLELENPWCIVWMEGVEMLAFLCSLLHSSFWQGHGDVCSYLPRHAR